MSEEREEHLSHDALMAQLVVIKERLETYPLAGHESICLKDCMLLLIRTIAGEKVEGLNLSNIGGGVMENSPEQGNSEFIGGEMRVGGVEIAPGVVQYPAAPNTSTMNVEESQRELNNSLKVTNAPIPDLPKAAPGSLMAQALTNEGKDDEHSIKEEAKQHVSTPDGIPAPSETTVEITS